MDIYIQSRGKNQDRDYRWLLITSDEHYPKNPDFLTQFIANSTFKPIDLIESQKPSIILVADRDNYYLLVTGLKANEDRTDFTGRSIRNSVLWICQKDGNNAKVRSLLIRALKGKLEQQIDKTISAGGKHGFEVDRESLEKFSDSVSNVEDNRNTDLSCKIGSNCELLRQKLALELQTSSLPDCNGLLVLITSIKSASALKESGVWRGLSNRIKDEFEVYSLLKTLDRQAQKKTILPKVIVIILLIAIAFLAMEFTTLQKPQPETIPIPSTTQENSSSTSTEKSNPSVNLIQIDKRNYLTSVNIFREGYGM